MQKHRGKATTVAEHRTSNLRRTLTEFRQVTIDQFQVTTERDELQTKLEQQEGERGFTSTNELKWQLQTLQRDYATAEEQNRHSTATIQEQTQQFEQKYQLLQTQYT